MTPQREARAKLHYCHCQLCRCVSLTTRDVCGFCREGLHAERVTCRECGAILAAECMGSQAPRQHDCGHSGPFRHEVLMRP